MRMMVRGFVRSEEVFERREGREGVKDKFRDMGVRRKKMKEVEEDGGVYKELVLWGKWGERVEKKKEIYMSDLVGVLGRFGEGWGEEELESGNGREVGGGGEELICGEREGGVKMEDGGV